MRPGKIELKDDAGYRAIQAIPGVGPTIAAIMVAEIGDVGRFKSAQALCSWAGLTPKHHHCDTLVRRGRISTAGSTPPARRPAWGLTWSP